MRQFVLNNPIYQERAEAMIGRRLEKYPGICHEKEE